MTNFFKKRSDIITQARAKGIQIPRNANRLNLTQVNQLVEQLGQEPIQRQPRRRPPKANKSMNYFKRASLINKQLTILNQPKMSWPPNKETFNRGLKRMDTGILNFLMQPRTNEEQKLKIVAPLKEVISVLEESKFNGEKYPLIKIGQQHFPLNMNFSNILNFINSGFNENAAQNLQGSEAKTVELYRQEGGAEIIIQPLGRGMRRQQRNQQGAYFPYTHSLDFDLSRYGLFNSVEQLKNEQDHCIVQALKIAGIENKVLNSVRIAIGKTYLKTSKLKNIAELIGRDIVLTKKGKTQNKQFKYKRNGTKDENPIKIGVVEGHYFLKEKIKGLKSFAVKNYEVVKHRPNWNNIYYIDPTNVKMCEEERKNMDTKTLYKYLTTKKNTVKTCKEDRRNVDTLTLVHYLVENKERFLKPNYYTSELEQSIHYKSTKFFDKLEIHENDYKMTQQKKPFYNTKSTNTIFFDFETITRKKKTEDNKHVPYLICCKNVEMKETKSFVGANCNREFLDYLGNLDCKRIRLYAHNLGYDLSFIINGIMLTTMFKDGSAIKYARAKKNKRDLELHDTYSMISSKLSKFGEMFHLDVEKDILPYEIYTTDSIQEKTHPIKDALNFIKKEDHKQFLENIKKWGLECENDTFDHIEYSRIYCEKDVKVLEEGYMKFREGMLKITNIDCMDKVSLPSIAHQYIIQEGCYEGVAQLRGQVRAFIQMAVQGGRTMCCRNEKHHVTITLADFDAVSLYPSAMNIMKGFPKGAPKVIPEELLKYDKLKEAADAFYVEIEVLDVGIHRDFPLVNYVDEKGSRCYANDFKGKVVVDNITLEDWIEFQDIKFTINKGYYFNEGFNTEINKVIETLFNERLKAKKVKNPIQLVYKLLMNSSYGKTIQKPIEDNLKFTYSEHDRLRFIENNYNRIKQFSKLNEFTTCFTTVEPIFSHFNYAHVGSLILSYSKRLMNQVMCLAEDNGIKIYYQDTDSMHIPKDSIPKLSKLYKTKYGKELIGKGMGQFHSDFDFSDNDKGFEPYAIESYFLGKKSYIDRVQIQVDGELQERIHFRMKGIPTACIDTVYKRIPNSEYKDFTSRKKANFEIMELYKALFEGKIVSFDLTAGKPCFELGSDFMYANREIFKRQISFRENKPKDLKRKMKKKLLPLIKQMTSSNK